ncbi:MAG: general stress protein CsbD [Bacteroidota bacterium]
MSKERMNQNWERMKAQIQSTWDGLEDAELKKARGSLTQMVNLIVNHTGEDRQVVMQKMSAFL